MALAPVDLLGAVESVVTTAIGGCDALRVNNRCAGLAVATFQNPEVTAQGVIDPFPRPISAPAPTVVIDDAPRRQIIGDKPPRTASAQDIQDRIDDLPFGIGFRPAARFGSRNQWFENLPFSIIEIGWVGFSGLHTAILSQQTNPIPTFFDTLSVIPLRVLNSKGGIP